jgi:hypothetical protein
MGRWAFVIYPGDYVERGQDVIRKITYPDYRLALFTDTFYNPITKLPADKRYTINGRSKKDNYIGHWALYNQSWTYEFHYIGAGGNTRVLYQNFPDYYDPVTEKYRNNYAVNGSSKLGYLGLWPTIWNSRTKPPTGGFNLHEGSYTFNAPADGYYRVHYYVEHSYTSTRSNIANAVTNQMLINGNIHPGMYWEERYNHYYIDSTCTNPSVNVDLHEKGNIILHGISNIVTDKYLSGTGSYYINSGGGAIIPFEANSGLDLGTSDFTIEGHFNFGRGGRSGSLITNGAGLLGRRAFELTYSGSVFNFKIYDKNSTARTTSLSSRTVNTNVWVHVTVMRKQTEVYMFVDGIQIDRKPTQVSSYVRNVGYVPNVFTYDLANGPGSFYIGGHQSGSVFSDLKYSKGPNVWIDSVRVSNIARYELPNINSPTVFFTAAPGDASNAMILNLSNNIIDTGYDERAMLAYGAVLPTTYSPFDESTNVNASILFTPTNWLRIPNHPAFNLPNDFTIDFRLLQSVGKQDSFCVISKSHPSITSKKSFSIIAKSTGWDLKFSQTGTTWTTRSISTGRPWNDWNSYRLSKNGANIRFYENGILLYSNILPFSNIFASDANITLGSEGDTSTATSAAVLNNIRIVSNAYTTVNAYVPLTTDYGYDFLETTANGTPESDTILLMGQPGNVLTDASLFQHNVIAKYLSSTNTANGNVFGIPLNPFTDVGTGTSYTWDSTDLQYVKFDPSSRFNILQNGTFTLEFWVRNNNPRKANVVDIITTGIKNLPSVNGDLTLALEGSSFKIYTKRPSVNTRDYPGVIKTWNYPTGLSCGSVSNPATWNHFAWVSDAGRWTFYINGSNVVSNVNTGINQVLATTGDPINFNISNGLMVCRPSTRRAFKGSSTSQFIGQLHGLRISNSIRYANAFTRPSEPFVNDAQTEFLEFNGPLTGASQSIASYAVNLQRGRIYMYDNPGILTLGSSDFTIETYIKLTRELPSYTDPSDPGYISTGHAFHWTSTRIALIDQLFLQANYTYYAQAYKEAGIFIGRTELYVLNNSINLGSVQHGMIVDLWYHVAVERVGSTITFYIDGNSVGSTSIAGDFFPHANGNRQLWFGAQKSGGPFSAKFSNFRVSTVARYNGNFTIPQDIFTSDASTRFLGMNQPTLTARIRNTDTAFLYTQGTVDVILDDSPFPAAGASSAITVYGKIRTTTNTPFASDVNKSHLFLYGSIDNPKEPIIDGGQGDYTVEYQLYKYRPWVSGQTLFYVKGSISGFNYIALTTDLSTSRKYRLICPTNNNLSWRDLYLGEFLPELNRWVHVVLMKRNDTLTLIVDGKIVFNLIDAGFKLGNISIALGGRQKGTSTIADGLLISNYRFSRVAQYEARINYPNNGLTSNEALFASNVVALAQFNNENYRRHPSQFAYQSYADGRNHGFEQTIYLANGQHTINVSAITQNRQGIWGGDIMTANGQIIWESRRDARDNSINNLRHPDSSVRGIHIRYAGSKPLYFQNALVNAVDYGSSAKMRYFPANTLSNVNYNPFEVEFTIKQGATKTVIVPDAINPDPDLKNRRRIIYQGRYREIQDIMRGYFLNVGIEGTKLNLNQGGGKITTFENCTFLYPNVTYLGTEYLSAPVTNLTGSGGTQGTGRLLIKRSIFGDTQRRLTKSMFQSSHTAYGNKWWLYRKYPLFVANLDVAAVRNTSRVVMNDVIFNAQVQANSFVVINNNIPAQLTEVAITFKYGSIPTQRYTIAPGANLTPSLLFYGNVVTTASPEFTNTVSIYLPWNGYKTSAQEQTSTIVQLPDIPAGNLLVEAGDEFLLENSDPLIYVYSVPAGVGNVYPRIETTGLLPAKSSYWSIKLSMYRNEPFQRVAPGAYESIWFHGNYLPKGTKGVVSIGKILPNSLALLAYPISNRTVTISGVRSTLPGQNYFKLLLWRWGTIAGETVTLTLTPQNIFDLNTWYDVEVDYADGLLKLIVNNETIAESDQNNVFPLKPAAAFNLDNNNTAKFILGKPPLLDYYSSYTTSSWRGYIRSLEVKSGADVQVSQAGVYNGTYRWFL